MLPSCCTCIRLLNSRILSDCAEKVGATKLTSRRERNKTIKDRKVRTFIKFLHRLL